MGLSFAASAPGRCGILGNPSDIYGGNVLSCSLPARASCRLKLVDEDDLPDDTTLWDAILSRVPLPPGVHVKVEWSTEVPRSSGLAGSTALLTTTLACILAIRGEAPDLSEAVARADLAEVVRDIEMNHANVVCGFQDAYMTVHGGLQLMNFAGKHPIHPGPHAAMRPLQAPLPFLLVTTGVERLSGSVHGPMMKRWLDDEPEVVSSMTEIAALVPAGAEALLSGDMITLGKAMDENHRLVAALGGSGDAIDRLIEQCKASGAIAAKLAGAGLGGTVIALTDAPKVLMERLTEAGYARFMKPEVAPGLVFEEWSGK